MRLLPEYREVDRARFEAEIVPAGRPAVLRGLVADWPIARAGGAGAEALAAWLRAHAADAPGEAWFGAPAIAGRFDFTADYEAHNHERKLASIAQLLALLLRQLGERDPWSIYAGALPVAKHLPAFGASHPMPLLDAARPMLVSLWLGNRTRTAAHWDLPQNLACVVAGRRRFTLFPPEQVANLYVGPIDRTLAGQPSSAVDLDAPDLARFPRFAAALAAAETAELAPGDALYMPSLWWHGVASLDPVGAMVNFWWRDGPARTPSPMQSLLHALVTLGELPATERAAWRAMFDHYLWRDDGDPAAHIPPAARGVLAERRDPELLARLRASLAESLSR